MKVYNNAGKAITPVMRVEDQFLGRPWERLAPTHEALATFGDTKID